MRLFAVSALAALFAAVADAATASFGYTASAGTWVISSGAGLQIKMAQSTCDITSMQLNGNELQYSSSHTQVNSGLGSLAASITTLSLDKASDTIQVTCKASATTQYFLFRSGENAIYMGTYSTDTSLPELRFLVRMDRSVMDSGVYQATYDSSTATAIEATDVYKLGNGTTRSKFYSGVAHIDDHVHGVHSTSINAGVYFIIPDQAYETSIGGPFFRDINNKIDTANELTFYMNSDHTRTENYRYGFHGPYAVKFTSGSVPATTDVDFDFFQSLSLTGFVANTGRGSITGTIKDSNSVLGSDDVVVAWSNSDAQYWVKVASGGTSFTSPMMLPGTYTMTVYKTQLAVGSSTVTVTKGAKTSATATVTYQFASSPIWRIGKWDGSPDGFLNSDKIHTMHPSDVAMSAWNPITFRPGVDSDSSFPMAQFRAANKQITLTFTLTKAQASEERTLRIGVTIAQNSGRNTITVNGAYTPATPASSAVLTRGITRGVTVGNYVVYEYVIPAAHLVTGTNTIALTIASGSTDPDETFLSASVAFDALELV